MESLKSAKIQKLAPNGTVDVGALMSQLGGSGGGGGRA